MIDVWLLLIISLLITNVILLVCEECGVDHHNLLWADQAVHHPAHLRLRVLHKPDPGKISLQLDGVVRQNKIPVLVSGGAKAPLDRDTRRVLLHVLLTDSRRYCQDIPPPAQALPHPQAQSRKREAGNIWGWIRHVPNPKWGAELGTIFRLHKRGQWSGQVNRKQTQPTHITQKGKSVINFVLGQRRRICHFLQDPQDQWSSSKSEARVHRQSTEPHSLQGFPKLLEEFQTQYIWTQPLRQQHRRLGRKVHFRGNQLIKIERLGYWFILQQHHWGRDQRPLRQYCDHSKSRQAFLKLRF